MSPADSSLRWGQAVSFSLVWLAYCSTYFLRKPLGVIKTDLGADLGLSKTQLGWCDLALSLPYALIQVSVVTNAKILTKNRIYVDTCIWFLKMFRILSMVLTVNIKYPFLVLTVNTKYHYCALTRNYIV